MATSKNAGESKGRRREILGIALLGLGLFSLISIVSMLILIRTKKKLGLQLSCDPLIADANCNLVCMYMSVVLLVASGAYELLHLGWIDTVGTAGIIYFSVKEGMESFEKAQALQEV